MVEESESLKGKVRQQAETIRQWKKKDKFLKDKEDKLNAQQKKLEEKEADRESLNKKDLAVSTH